LRGAASDIIDRVEETDQLFEQNDTAGNGDIDFGEFIGWWLTD
jgi:hypothetical protein